MFKSLIRFIFVNIMTFSLITNTIATETKPFYSDEYLTNIVNAINSKENTPLTMIDTYKKNETPEKINDLKLFFKKYSEYQNIKFSKTALENGKISFIADREKVYISLINKTELLIEVMGKKIVLENSMLFSEMVNKISNVINDKKISFFNLFIQDSYAVLQLVEVAILIAGIAAFIIATYKFLDNGDISRTVKSYEALCANWKNIDMAEDQISLLTSSYNLLSRTQREHCLSGEPATVDNCKKLLSIKQCFSDKIKESTSGAVNNSSKSIQKVMEYDGKTDQYVKGASK